MAGEQASRPSEPARGDPRVALVHDYLLVMRGAERSFAAIADRYGQAPIFTLLYDEHGTDGRFAGRSGSVRPRFRTDEEQP